MSILGVTYKLYLFITLFIIIFFITGCWPVFSFPRKTRVPCQDLKHNKGDLFPGTTSWFTGKDGGRKGNDRELCRQAWLFTALLHFEIYLGRIKKGPRWTNRALLIAQWANHACERNPSQSLVTTSSPPSPGLCHLRDVNPTLCCWLTGFLPPGS